MGLGVVNWGGGIIRVKYSDGWVWYLVEDSMELRLAVAREVSGMAAEVVGDLAAVQYHVQTMTR